MAPSTTKEEGEETDSRDRVGAGFRKVDWDWIGEGREEEGRQGLFRLFQEEVLPSHIWGTALGSLSSVSAPLTAATPPEEHSGYSCALASNAASLRPLPDKVTRHEV